MGQVVTTTSYYEQKTLFKAEVCQWRNRSKCLYRREYCKKFQTQLLYSICLYRSSDWNHNLAEVADIWFASVNAGKMWPLLTPHAPNPFFSWCRITVRITADFTARVAIILFVGINILQFSLFQGLCFFVFFCQLLCSQSTLLRCTCRYARTTLFFCQSAFSYEIQLFYKILSFWMFMKCYRLNQNQQR